MSKHSVVRNKKEKLYIIRDDRNEIFAISESRKEIELFYIQNNYKNKGFTITRLDNTEAINRVQLMYYDLYIDEFYDEFYVRFTDIKPLMDLIYEQEQGIRNTIDTLNQLVSDHKIDKISTIEAMIKTSKYLSKNIKEIVDVYGIISQYYNTPSIMDHYREYQNYMNIFC